MDDPFLWVGWSLSLPFIVHLWCRRRATIPKKVVLSVPYLGLLFYGALFKPLSPQGEHLKAQDTWYASGSTNDYDARRFVRAAIGVDSHGRGRRDPPVDDGMIRADNHSANRALNPSVLTIVRERWWS